MPELTTLEYPRHVHKPEGAYLRVENAVECADALDAGWSIDVPVDVPAEPVIDVEPVIDAEPAKRKAKK